MDCCKKVYLITIIKRKYNQFDFNFDHLAIFFKVKLFLSNGDEYVVQIYEDVCYSAFYIENA